jgi:hypothetical protein
MPRFYIEIPHEADKVACLRAVKILQETGSHFLTHAEYGCLDGDHTARIIVEVDSKAEALRVIPPAYRDKTRIVALTTFSTEEVERLLRHHPGD